MIVADVYTFKDPYRHREQIEVATVEELEQKLLLPRLSGELVGVLAREFNDLGEPGDIVYEWWDRKARGNWATAKHK